MSIWWQTRPVLIWAATAFLILIGASCANQGSGSDKVVTGKAVVDSIQILILESFPVQVNVVARGNFPDGCTKMGQITQERQSHTFLLTLTTHRPTEALCTQALVPFRETIALNVQGLKAGVYTVNVNGVIDTFELHVDNIPQS